MLELIKRGVYPEARRSEAQSTLDSAEAVVVQAEAALEEARQALGPSGAENPRIRDAIAALAQRSEEHTSELQSLMRISYAVFCLKKKKTTKNNCTSTNH